MDIQIQVRDNRSVDVAIFDMTAALDDTISDMARGLLFRVFAVAHRHQTMYGSLINLTLERLARGSPDGIEAVRACLRELADHGYVKRWKEAGHWVIEFSAVPPKEAEAVPVLDMPPPKKKATRKPRTASSKPRKIPQSSAPAKKSQYRPEYRSAILTWLQAPDGGDTVVVSKEWSRVQMSVNTILEIATARGWIDSSDSSEEVFGEIDTHTLVTFITACWHWIKKGDGYRGNQDIHNVARRLQDWWKQEGERQYGGDAPRDDYTPMMI